MVVTVGETRLFLDRGGGKEVWCGGGVLSFYKAELFVASHNVNCYRRRARTHPRSKTSRRFTIGLDSSLEWISIDQGQTPSSWNPPLRQRFCVSKGEDFATDVDWMSVVFEAWGYSKLCSAPVLRRNQCLHLLNRRDYLDDGKSEILRNVDIRYETTRRHTPQDGSPNQK